MGPPPLPVPESRPPEKRHVLRGSPPRRRQRLVHVSGIGADPGSPSAYIRSRSAGEAAVLRTFAAATLIRPAVMFGPDDGFVAPLLSMLRRLPAIPLFGSGAARLQPVYVEDIGDAVARIMRLPATERIYELAGPQVYDYRSLLLVLGESFGRELLLPVPFALWKAIGTAGELLPSPPITRSQVELMECDNIASPGMPGFANLQMAPRSLEEMLPQINPDRGGHYGLVHSRTAPNNPLVIAYEEFWQTMKATLRAGSAREGLAKLWGPP
jgi:nucleoside-diphosphate-sugar epimerase